MHLIQTRRGDEQQVFDFVQRSRRRTLLFKTVILTATLATLAGIIASSPIGRYGVLAVAYRVRWAVRSIVGLAPPREEVEADQHAARLVAIGRTRAALGRELDRGGPKVRRLFESTQMDPESAVIRWGNYNATLVLSSGVFEPDDHGRSYRLRPQTRSIWCVGLSFREALCQFLVPDTPEARDACHDASGAIVEESVQTTNSWGCRGPEPDTNAPLRGIVLGDSVIQGVLVRDDETAPACLEREMARQTGVHVSILNAGVLGYSPEQYYYSLEAFDDRINPHFVVVGLCGNDFGDWNNTEDWKESCYWLDRIRQRCQTRQIPMLIVPWPGEDMLLGIRDMSRYPGQVTHYMKANGTMYFDPTEAFTNEEFRLRIAMERQGTPVVSSPLYNRQRWGDNHLSAKGCALWGRLVAERLYWVLDRRKMLPANASESQGLSRTLDSEPPARPERKTAGSRTPLAP